MLARTRRHAWIVRGRAAARKAAKSCMECRLHSKRLVQQQMGKVPDEVAKQCPPFLHVSVDLFGPLLAKGLGGHARKAFKTWGVLFSCLGSRAVSVWLAASYSTSDFLQCLQRQISIYGVPASIHSDRGRQLVSAASDVREWEGLAEEARKLGISWTFSPVACPWRNGQAERAVGLIKSSLKHQVDSYELLSYAELETALLRIAAIVNQRPLAVRLYSDSDFYPVSPSDLLLGRMAGYGGTQEERVGEFELGPRMEKIQRLVELWWRKWEEQAFLLFTPRKKWRLEARPVQEGDIVLLKSDSKLGPGTYRLARIVELHGDEDGVVRTVTLLLKSRRRQRNVVMERVVMAIQRLSMLLPKEEQIIGEVVNPQ